MESLGISVAGGMCSPRGDTPIFVTNINPQGCLGKSGNIKVSWVAQLLPYLFGYKTGLSLSRMSTNNQISPMQFCCYTGFTLPKQYQRSRSVLYGSRFLGLFWKEKNTVL